MPIPPLTDDGLLPPGVHDCTLEEVQEVFGRFQRSDRRLRLTSQLGDYADLTRRAGIGSHLYLDGSFVTAKEEPGDVDLLLVLRDDVNLDGPLPPIQYNARSRKFVRKHYEFDVFFGFEGDESTEMALQLFRQVKHRPGAEKGVLRVRL